MKQENRKLISGLIAAALVTSIFTGCDSDTTDDTITRPCLDRTPCTGAETY